METTTEQSLERSGGLGEAGRVTRKEGEAGATRSITSTAFAGQACLLPHSMIALDVHLRGREGSLLVNNGCIEAMSRLKRIFRKEGGPRRWTGESRREEQETNAAAKTGQDI